MMVVDHEIEYFRTFRAPSLLFDTVHFRSYPFVEEFTAEIKLRLKELTF